MKADGRVGEVNGVARDGDPASPRLLTEQVPQGGDDSIRTGLIHPAAGAVGVDLLVVGGAVIHQHEVAVAVGAAACVAAATWLPLGLLASLGGIAELRTESRTIILTKKKNQNGSNN
ncbi:hypothetical protein KQ310_07795 [Synechococcus sp. CS-1328]|nr:hypothetical protein [Synechococcus sp. CS-1328]